MSNLSIFDKKWIDVVFDGKNKEYGAYELRQENEKTTFRAFGLGIILVFSCIGIFTLSSFFSANAIIPIDASPTIDLKITKIHYPDKIINLEPIVEKNKTQKTFSESTELKNPIVTTASNATPEIADNKDNGKITNVVGPVSNGAPTDNPANGNSITDIAAPKIIDNSPKSTSELDKQPNFPGGLDKFRNFVGSNFEKPEMEEDKILTVKVSFVVEKDGSLSNIKVLQDPGFGLGDEAIRVLKLLKTRWEPGLIDGEKVRTLFNLPISVKTD